MQRTLPAPWAALPVLCGRPHSATNRVQDYKVHIKHTDGHFEYIPYFCLPANDLNDVIAPSCYTCFDYPNAVADLVVGYMGVPWQGVNMTEHQQVVTVRSPGFTCMWKRPSD